MIDFPSQSIAAQAFRLALVQCLPGSNKAQNLQTVAELVREAAKNGSQMIALPECFNSPYGVSYFPDYCEPIPGGETTRTLSELAKETKTYLIGGKPIDQALCMTIKSLTLYM